MKKITLLAISSALFLASCQHQNRQTKLDFGAEKINQSSVGNGKEITIIATDERGDINVIGKKEFIDDKKVTISLEGTTLIQVVSEKVSNALRQQDFFIKSSNVIFGGGKVECRNVAKCVTISIKSFKYKSEDGFVVGKTKFKGQILVSVTNPKNSNKFERVYEFETKNNHFIGASKERDDKNINKALKEVIENITEDEALLKHLSL